LDATLAAGHAIRATELQIWRQNATAVIIKSRKGQSRHNVAHLPIAPIEAEISQSGETCWYFRATRSETRDPELWP